MVLDRVVDDLNQTFPNGVEVTVMQHVDLGDRAIHGFTGIEGVSFIVTFSRYISAYPSTKSASKQ